MANGLGQLQKLDSLVELPLFRMASDFIADATMADMPAPSGWPETADGPSEPELWYMDFLPMITAAMQKVTNYWSIFDFGVFIVEPGLVRAADPKYYFRVGLPEQRDADVGHVLLFPWLDGTTQYLQSTDTDNAEPNRITIIKVLANGGGATIQTFMFNGGIVGNPLTAAQASPITAILTCGEGDSWYGGAANTAAALMINVSMGLVELNHYANRAKLLPSSSVAAIATAAGVAPGTPGGQQAIRRGLEETLRPILAADKDDVGPGFGDMDEPIQLEDRRAMNEYLGDLFFLESRLTPSSYGIGIGRGESGVAREKAQDAAGAKIRRYRRQLAGKLTEMVEAMGIPGGRGKLQFSWAVPPFQSKEAREEHIRQDFQAGLLTPNEARYELGLGPLPGGDELASAREERMADMDRQAMAQGRQNATQNNGNMPQ